MKRITTLFMFIFTCALSFSQVTTSSIKGLISDETNAGLPGANVIAVHTPTWRLLQKEVFRHLIKYAHLGLCLKENAHRS